MRQLSYINRRRFSLVILLVGLPLYIIFAIFIVHLFNRPSILFEMLVYVVLGFLWILPFRFVFLGIGKPAPDAEEAPSER
jgi:hypothetical protein